MTVHIGTDHRGFKLKEAVVSFLHAQGHQVVDHGNSTYDATDDYSDYTVPVANAVAAATDPQNVRGIVLCGSGVGVSIVANKVAGVRAVLGFLDEQVAHSRDSDNCTVLALPADYLAVKEAEKLVATFLSTEFKGESEDLRRIAKITKQESEQVEKK